MPEMTNLGALGWATPITERKWPDRPQTNLPGEAVPANDGNRLLPDAIHSPEE
jgi:hypothetical protein